MPLPKTSTCRLCGASFVIENNEQKFCKECLEITEIKQLSDFQLNINEMPEKIKQEIKQNVSRR